MNKNTQWLVYFLILITLIVIVGCGINDKVELNHVADNGIVGNSIDHDSRLNDASNVAIDASLKDSMNDNVSKSSDGTSSNDSNNDDINKGDNSTTSNDNNVEDDSKVDNNTKGNADSNPSSNNQVASSNDHLQEGSASKSPEHLQQESTSKFSDNVQKKSNIVYVKVNGPSEIGTILNVELPLETEDITVLEALLIACEKENIIVDYSGGIISAYIKGIDNIYEMDYGPLSGWIYSVNGDFPTISSGQKTVKEGDVITFYYTKDLGKDVK
jgi:hypothetical protein